MARLLVSVRNTVEAAAAVRGGADIIDVKEPHHGPLGRADDRVVRAVVRAVRDRPRSVALGELIDGLEDGRSPLPPLDGVHFAKVGLAGCAGRSDWPAKWRALQRRIGDVSGGHTGLVAAAYADPARASAPPVADVLNLAGEAGCGVFLLDTWRKDGRGLLDWMPPDALVWLSVGCAERGLELALAGSLGPADLIRLRAVGPAIVAVRGAACRGGERQASVRAVSVRRLARLVHPMAAIGSTPPAVPAGS